MAHIVPDLCNNNNYNHDNNKALKAKKKRKKKDSSNVKAHEYSYNYDSGPNLIIAFIWIRFWKRTNLLNLRQNSRFYRNMLHVCPSTMHIMDIKILHILHIQSDVLQCILDSLS